jgi:hypothetical protein
MSWLPSVSRCGGRCLGPTAQGDSDHETRGLLRRFPRHAQAIGRRQPSSSSPSQAITPGSASQTGSQCAACRSGTHSKVSSLNRSILEGGPSGTDRERVWSGRVRQHRRPYNHLPATVGAVPHVCDKKRTAAWLAVTSSSLLIDNNCDHNIAIWHHFDGLEGKLVDIVDRERCEPICSRLPPNFVVGYANSGASIVSSVGRSFR